MGRRSKNGISTIDQGFHGIALASSSIFQRGRAWMLASNFLGMDASVAVTRHITSLIIVMSITWQCLVPCRCEFCCHASIVSQSNNDVSEFGCGHSPILPASCPHDASSESGDDRSSPHPESQPAPCHRFAGFISPNRSVIDSFVAVAVVTSPAEYTLEFIVNGNAFDWFRDCDLSHRRIDPGTFVRLQV